MSNPVMNGFLAALLLFGLAAGAAGLLLDRASRHPAAATALLALLLIGLSWGGTVMLSE